MIWDISIRGFKAYLRLERGLSDHSIKAYILDVRKLVSFLELHELDISPRAIQQQHLEDFLVWLNALGLGARSQGRVLSGIKTFYKYLHAEEVLKDDPTELLEGPKFGRYIPEVLTYEEIQKLLSTID